MARATTSLPEPLSPVISTLASDRATRSTSAFSSVMAGLVPISCTLEVCLVVIKTTLLNKRPTKLCDHNQDSVLASAPRCEARATLHVLLATQFPVAPDIARRLPGVEPARINAPICFQMKQLFLPDGETLPGVRRSKVAKTRNKLIQKSFIGETFELPQEVESLPAITEIVGSVYVAEFDKLLIRQLLVRRYSTSC